jgi:hypothetical protein
MMNDTLETLILMLAFAIILCFSTDTTIKLVSSEETRGKIDIFTQKEPFSGKGLNMPSDAFHLEEEADIYASVT